MRIPNTYFNRFMLVTALFCAVAIAAGSFSYLNRQEQRFVDRLEGQMLEDLVFYDKNSDSVSVNPGEKAIVLFWATWSDRSIKSLNELYQGLGQYPDYTMIAAYVKDAYELAVKHDRPENDLFFLVDGTAVYQDLRVPGVPSLIIVGEDGFASGIIIGRPSIEDWIQSERYQKSE